MIHFIIFLIALLVGCNSNTPTPQQLSFEEKSSNSPPKFQSSPKISTAKEKIIIKAGELNKLENYPVDSDVYVYKLDGTLPDSPNDLKITMKNFIHYKFETYFYARNMMPGKAKGARGWFDIYAKKLEDYHEDDVAQMQTWLENEGFNYYYIPD